MSNTINIKFTKNLDHFIINLLPYVELFLKDNDDILSIYSNEYVCEILLMMFGENRIRIQKIKHTFNLPENTLELDKLIDEYYQIKTDLITRPLNPPKNNCLLNKKYICIFPKFNQKDTFHSFTTQMLDGIFNKINFNKMGYEVFVIGHPFEKINTKYGRDLDNFKDIVSHLKYCNLFITSESHWKYISLLCNCRNVIVYNSNKRELNQSEKYNPYNNNIYTTHDILSDETYQKIMNVLK